MMHLIRSTAVLGLLCISRGGHARSADARTCGQWPALSRVNTRAAVAIGPIAPCLAEVKQIDAASFG